MVLGPLLMILIPALLIVTVLLAARRPRPPATRPPPPQATLLHAPLGLLQEPFARGELHKQEYEERSRILRDQGDDT